MQFDEQMQIVRMWSTMPLCQISSVFLNTLHAPWLQVQDPSNLEKDDLSDPTEAIAARLGLDQSLLAHNTGLSGNDARGALARLRFALAHPSTHACGSVELTPHHQVTTKAATLKQRERAAVPLFTAPSPMSPHLQQVCVSLLSLKGLAEE
jgi:hypothetical protein